MYLEERFKTWLPTQKESGMGYQNVDFHMKDGSVIKNVAVFNGCECALNIDQDKIASIKLSERE